MSILKIVQDNDPFLELSNLLDILHREGPINAEILESISYFKKFHPEVFTELEERIISALGLFYKIKEPKNIYSFLLSGFGEQHKKDYGEYLTPVQAIIRRAVDNNRVISISAPTSAGKSYSIRDFIAEQEGDAVVVVPSRALIAEYINTMKRKFNGDKTVMISPFIDNVFTSRKLRRIFILTPERARDLFTSDFNLRINVFFFDEAQVSEEKERGVIFDVMIRRVQRHFPFSKLIFAHPFAANPDAQLKKHGFSNEDGYARSYTHGSVGKICVFQHSNKKCYYFSPYIKKGHIIKNCIEFPIKFGDFSFNGEHSVLVYVSKTSIYNESFLNEFQKYIDKFPIIELEEAREIINTIEHALGADQDGHDSLLVSLLRRGVVIHHGSVPLEIRFLVEDFIRSGFAKICFATSTLAQGINMPFDIVWLENMRFLGEDGNSRSLAFKNLIGRSGRLSNEQKFDFGYVFTKSPILFSNRINDEFRLDEKSVIDTPLSEQNQDSVELIDSIRTETFDDDKQMPKTKVERLSSSDILECSIKIINIIYKSGQSIKENTSGVSNKNARNEIKKYFLDIFETSIDRKLHDGEGAVFEQAISIFLHVIQGRSFREIVGIRYSYISRRDEGHRGNAKFSQPAETLPKSTLTNVFSIFDRNTRAEEVSYDAIVFDTYDYLDQVISFSLSETFIAAFKIYRDHTQDQQADKMIELLRFGTNNTVHTLLMRYGFPPEEIAEIKLYIQSINEENIIFKNEIEHAPMHIKTLTEWYRP